MMIWTTPVFVTEGAMKSCSCYIPLRSKRSECMAENRSQLSSLFSNHFARAGHAALTELSENLEAQYVG